MSTNLAGVLYGTIMIGTLLAAESATNETYAESVAAAVIAIILYWLVHSYVDFTGERLRDGEPLEFSHLGRVLRHDLAIAIGALIPLLELVICWIAGVSLDNALVGAVWASAAVIVLTEVTAGIRSGEKGFELVWEIVMGAVFGFLIIALRLVLH